MFKFLSTLTVLSLFMDFAYAQQSWRVNNIPGIEADFTSVPDAVAAAAAGDTIYVESSPYNYSGTVIINKKLYIYGTGYFLSDSINPKTQWDRNEAYISTTIFLDAGSTGSIISGLRTETIRLSDSALIIERCLTGNIYLAYRANSIANNSVIRQNYISGSIVSNTSTGTARDILIHNNIIRVSVDSRNNLDNTTAYFINNNFINNNNIFTTNFIFQNNIFRNPNFSTYLDANAFYNNISNDNDLPAANGNQSGVNLDNVYVNYNGGSTTPSTGFSADGKYKLKPGSVAENAGDINGTAVDIGAYGGPAPYILSGMPPIPSIYELTVPHQINAGVPTMTISVSAAAH